MAILIDISVPAIAVENRYPLEPIKSSKKAAQMPYLMFFKENTNIKPVTSQNDKSPQTGKR